MKSLCRALLVGSWVALVAAGCTSMPAELSYEAFSAYASDRAGNRTYIELGPVTVTHRGPLWRSCDDLARRVLEELNDKRAALGGDALVRVRWSDHRTAEPANVPHCTREWGWGGFAGIGLFLPWAQVSQAEALVIRFEDE